MGTIIETALRNLESNAFAGMGEDDNFFFFPVGDQHIRVCGYVRYPQYQEYDEEGWLQTVEDKSCPEVYFDVWIPEAPRGGLRIDDALKILLAL